MSIQIKITEEYKNLVPDLPKQYYRELKKSIKENGLWHPITVNRDGTILDGHHRFKVCIELQIEPKYEIKEFGNKLSEKLFVIDSNLNRRHLNTFGRVVLALSKKPILEEIARNNMSLAGKGDRNLTPLGRVDEKIANDAHTSRDTVRKIEYILENAISKYL